MTQRAKLKLEKISCSHCGDLCTDENLIMDGKAFCCNGCQSVYELFQLNGLQQYYQLENAPGISLKEIQTEKFAYLDDKEVLTQLLDFSNEDISRVTFNLPEIHCASCIWLLENLHKLEPGVQQSTVNFLKKEVYISFDPAEVKLSRIAALLQRIGYPPNINLADLDQKPPAVVSKSLYYKLGVTGFLFGNIMFMSFPEYMGIDKSSGGFYFQFFAYLNLVLGIPLVLYSGWGYLRSAFLGLRHGQLNIDVPISIGILSLFGRSAYEVLTHTGAGYMDSLAGLVFFLLVGKWFQQKTYHSISFERDYQSYFPIAANKIEDGEESSVSLKQLTTGDKLLIRHQELIPADGMLMEGEAYIDYSFVTGESVPQKITTGEIIYAGGRQVGGAIQIQLTKSVVQSYLVQLWNEYVFDHKKKEETSSQLATKVGKWFTVFILAIAFSSLAYWLPKDTAMAINAFSAVLIIACPCAVALSIPFTFGNVLRILGRQQLYLKNTGVIERIQQVTHLVFDKTGTLTEREETIQFKGELSPEEALMVKSLANQSTHPRSRQISTYFSFATTKKVSDFKEERGVGTSGIVDGQAISIFKTDEGTAVAVNSTTKGYFQHQPVLRAGLRNSISQLLKKYKLFLLSGDQDRHQGVFNDLFGQANRLHFDCTPKDKLNFIKKLQDEENAVVMMIGDGLNDAGALKQADVGLVISEDNNNFTPACDGIIAASCFEKLICYIRYINQSRKVIYFSYAFALIYNVIGLSFAVQGTLSPVIAAILMPLSSISIIAFGMFGSWYLGRHLGEDKVEKLIASEPVFVR